MAAGARERVAAMQFPPNLLAICPQKLVEEAIAWSRERCALSWVPAS